MWYFNISIDECLIWKSKTWFQTRLNFFFDSVMNEGPERLFEAHSGHFDSLLLNITISLIPLDDCFIWYKVMVGLILTKAMVTYTHLFSLSCHWLQVHIIVLNVTVVLVFVVNLFICVYNRNRRNQRVQ